MPNPDRPASVPDRRGAGPGGPVTAGGGRRGGERLHAARILILSFGGAILAGTILLGLGAAATGPPLAPVDALFTAASAVCVTGLTVIDPGTRLSGFGQVVLILLIQLGGLGITTLSTAFLLASGHRLSLSGQVVIRGTLSRARDRPLGSFVRHVVTGTLLTELAGAACLTLLFRRTMPWALAAKHGAFHSVSAFCNSGFSLNGDSLAAYRGDPGVNLVVMALIVLGGIGYVVLLNTKNHLLGDDMGERRRLTFHTRLVLTATAILLGGGFIALLATEWRGALGGLPLPDRLLAAAFQSVTCRTAGFSTLDMAALSLPGIFVIMVLMMIGASPGSSGGGLKTTTAAVLFGLVRSRWRGEHGVEFFRRTVPEATVDRAVAAAGLGVAAIGIVTFALLLSECGVRGAAPAGRFLELGFEAVSALGTVGLSLGATPELSSAGRVIVALAMFVGRLGPLGVAVAVAGRERPRVLHAEEEVMIG